MNTDELMYRLIQPNPGTEYTYQVLTLLFVEGVGVVYTIYW